MHVIHPHPPRAVTMTQVDRVRAAAGSRSRERQSRTANVAAARDAARKLDRAGDGRRIVAAS